MMKLYQKNDMHFTLAVIFTYVFLTSLAKNLSAAVGVKELFSAPLAVVMALVLGRFVTKNGLKEKYGLCPFRENPRDYLYFIPLFLLVCVNLFGELGLHTSILEVCLHIVLMLAVGFLEELIFRGFLFEAIRKDSLKQAVIISSVTFGIGHIVNLLNGAAFLPTLMQVLYATAIGFAFTIFFLRSGCLWPLVACHSLVNALSVFSGPKSLPLEAAGTVFMIAVSLFYAWWILTHTKKRAR